MNSFDERCCGFSLRIATSCRRSTGAGRTVSIVVEAPGGELTAYFPRYPCFPAAARKCSHRFHSQHGECSVPRQNRIDKSMIPLFSGWLWAPSILLPATVFAQSSPYNTGATSLLTFALTIATPIAALVVIGLAIAAAVGQVSWGWVVGAIVGIAAIFGAPQSVTWIRGLFAV